MKTIIQLTFLILFASVAKAQDVTIPDTNFLSKLISLGVDTSNDGIIQVSEALVVSSLDVSSSNISSLSGIDDFVNLQNLDCSNNSLINLDLTGVVDLITLNCSSNQLSSLGVNICLNLIYLNCNNNQLFDLSLIGNVNIINVDCSNNNITTADITFFNPNIEVLNCSSNQITSLNVSQNVLLLQLICTSNQLTTLDVSQNLILEQLKLNINQITSLNLDQNLNLTLLSCDQNLLTSLDLLNNTNLEELYCNQNNLTSLNLTNNINLNVLSCGFNQLTALNVAQNINLNTLDFRFNQLTTLDVTNNRLLNILTCINNAIVTLFIKNGSIESTINLGANPNLVYICADEAQISTVQTLAGPTVEVNSYCSFIPGGNYNQIGGNIKFDINNNGCDPLDDIQPNIRVNITGDTNPRATFTDQNGDYVFYSQIGNFTLTPALENQSFFTVTPNTVTIPFANNNNNSVTQDFCIAANGIHNDVEIIIAPITPARPGFDADYLISYKNKGNQTLSGTFSLLFNDAVLDFVSTTLAIQSQSIGNLNWQYENLLPFESRSLVVTFNVNAPTEIPAINIGDELNFSVSITPLVSDENPIDNNLQYTQTVVGSFDPNSITCIEGDMVSSSEIGNYLHYVINFENTGNSDAENVVIKCIVDPTKYDINSMQVINASHNLETKIDGDKVEYFLKQIQLGGPGGHGHILLKIRTNNNLQNGDSVSEEANIYFDYNFPVETNQETSTFQTLSNAVFQLDNSISSYPNPAVSVVTIKSDNQIKSVQLFDVQGRLLQVKSCNNTQSTLDISNQNNGVYFLKTETSIGSKIEKLIIK